MKKTNRVYKVLFTEGKSEVVYTGTLAELKKIFGVVSSGKNPVFVDDVLLYHYKSPNNIKGLLNQLNMQFLYQSYTKDYIPEITLVQ